MKSSDKVAKEFRKNWERHHPFRNLNFQLSLVERLRDEADKELANYPIGAAVPEWVILYYDLALNRIVSSFEFFFRELVLNEYILNSTQKSNYYKKTTGRFKKPNGNFQNYDSIRKFLINEFKIDIETVMKPLEIEWLKYIVMIRHILTHNGGIVDKDFMDLIGSFRLLKVQEYNVGSWFGANSETINIAKTIVQKVKEIVEEEVKKLDKPEIKILFEP